MDETIERYRARRKRRLEARFDGEFKENEHPRGKDGKFTSGSSSKKSNEELWEENDKFNEGQKHKADLDFPEDSKVNRELVYKSVDRARKMLDMVGVPQLRVDIVDWKDSEGFENASTDYDWKIKLPADKWQDDEVQEDKFGQPIRNSTKEDKMVHEFAHLVERDMLERSDMTEGCRRNMWNDGKMSGAVVKRALRNMGIKDGNDEIKEMRKISGYAGHNYQECFAEALTDCARNGKDAQELSKAILKQLKGFYKNKR